MRYKGKIEDPKDLVTKEYVDNSTRSPLYERGLTPPSNTNEFWLNPTDNAFYLYDSIMEDWLPIAQITDKGTSVIEEITFRDSATFYLTSVIDSLNYKTDEPLSSSAALYTDMLTKEVN